MPKDPPVRPFCLAVMLVTLAPAAIIQTQNAIQMPALDTPETRADDLVEPFFGTDVPDPYRQLEAEAASDPAMANWVAAQNKVTKDYLATLPGRAVFRERIAAYFDYDRTSSPYKRGDMYFYTRNSGFQNQGSLVVREGVDRAERVPTDPNTWSDDGATALAEWKPSADGAHLADGVQGGGTDWRTISVLDVATGEVLVRASGRLVGH